MPVNKIHVHYRDPSPGQAAVRIHGAVGKALSLSDCMIYFYQDMVEPPAETVIALDALAGGAEERITAPATPEDAPELVRLIVGRYILDPVTAIHIGRWMVHLGQSVLERSQATAGARGSRPGMPGEGVPPRRDSGA
ncbi:MAG: hypothetical protein QJR14_08670 [Bacillota bacterium]|nr:hypothetical protein [Bacillota bacterium]